MVDVMAYTFGFRTRLMDESNEMNTIQQLLSAIPEQRVYKKWYLMDLDKQAYICVERVEGGPINVLLCTPVGVMSLTEVTDKEVNLEKENPTVDVTMDIIEDMPIEWLSRLITYLKPRVKAYTYLIDTGQVRFWFTTKVDFLTTVDHFPWLIDGDVPWRNI